MPKNKRTKSKASGGFTVLPPRPPKDEAERRFRQLQDAKMRMGGANQQKRGQPSLPKLNLPEP